MKISQVDSGKAPERTALAWQRTALAVIAASAILARLTFGRLGWSMLAALITALLLAAWALTEHRHGVMDGRTRETMYRGSGHRAIALALATSIIALTELVALSWPE